MEKLKIRIEESVDGVSRLENIAHILLLVSVFLMPIFFIPSVIFPFQFSKSIFISLAVIAVFVLWVIARLKDGRFSLPNNLVFLGAGAVIFSSFISAVLSPVSSFSIIGNGFEVGTWASFLIMFVMMFLFAVLFRPKEKVFYLYLVLFCSFFIIVLFYFLRFLFGADFLSFGLFTNITSNLIGKWNDLGIFFALVTVLSTVTSGLLSLNRFFKLLVFSIFVLSMFALIVVNFNTIWYVLLFFSVVFSVYVYSFGREFRSEHGDHKNNSLTKSPSAKFRGVSLLALSVMAFSLIFLADGHIDSRPLSSRIGNFFNVSHLEVRPNWSSTIYVAKNTLAKDPFFGVGLNRFTNEWLLHKPVGINESVFWNTDFNYGIGLLPTLLVTSGMVGLLSWMFFLGSLVYLGVRAILFPVIDKLSRYLLVSSFFASIFLWSFFVFYIPSAVIVSLTFLFTGVFLASLYNDKIIKSKTISFAEEPKANFVSVLMLTVSLIGIVILGYVFVQKFVAVSYFQRALVSFNQNGDIVKAESYGKKAVSLSENSGYYRFLSELTLVKINNLLSLGQPDPSIDAVRLEFQTLLGDALDYSRKAIDYDGTDYQNWVSLGRVYEAVVPLKIDGAYENAANAYEKAVALNPRSPFLDLNMARLEFARQNTASAKEYIDSALAKKFNYTEALFLKSQIQASEGDLVQAIASVEDASILAPNDPTVFFQLGLLKYNNRDYGGSVEAFLRAVRLEPTYSNAKYFLGLGYDRLGMKDEALAEFKDILVLNPDNQEVGQVIVNLEEGRDPFYGIRASSRPENRDTLPIAEDLVEE